MFALLVGRSTIFFVCKKVSAVKSLQQLNQHVICDCKIVKLSIENAKIIGKPTENVNLPLLYLPLRCKLRVYFTGTPYSARNLHRVQIAQCTSVQMVLNSREAVNLFFDFAKYCILKLVFVFNTFMFIVFC